MPPSPAALGRHFLPGTAGPRRLALLRRRLVSAARGTVLDLGGAGGPDLDAYPPAVRRIVVASGPGARQRGLERPPGAVPAEVCEAWVDEAPFPPESFDTVVSVLALCSVPDLDAALGAVRRLLRRDGSFLFLEHVRGAGVTGRAQAAGAPGWCRWAGGCRPDRDVPAAVRRAGLVITDIDRFRLPLAQPLVAPAVRATARVPAAARIAGPPPAGGEPEAAVGT